MKRHTRLGIDTQLSPSMDSIQLPVMLNNRMLGNCKWAMSFIKTALSFLSMLQQMLPSSSYSTFHSSRFLILTRFSSSFHLPSPSSWNMYRIGLFFSGTFVVDAGSSLPKDTIISLYLQS